MNNFKYYLIGGASALFSALGLLALPLSLLVICNVADWVTGLMAASYSETAVTSKKSLKGITKKIAMYFLVFVGFILDLLIIYATESLGIDLVLPNVVACIVATWLVLHELLSITENCLALGIEVPFLKPFIALIKGKVEKQGDISNE